MLFRVGVNLGDVVVKGDDILGDGVNVAARLETVAEPGGICISSSVYDQITGKLDLGFHDIGEQSLKNISRPIRAYRISGAGAALPRPAATAPRRLMPWLAAAVVIGAIVAAALVWQGNQGPATQPAVTTGKEVGADAAVASREASESEARRQRAEAEADAMKRQAEEELARARAEAEAGRAARAKAEADAAKIRSAAESRITKPVAIAPAPNPPPAKVLNPSDTATSVEMKAEVAQGASIPADTGTRAAQGGASRFDGLWNVTLVCPDAADGALGYSHFFSAQVKDGYLQGQLGTPGNPGSLELKGNIRPDGSARLYAKGYTGNPKYTVNQVKLGTPVEYEVEAQFEGAQGSGRRLQLRPCALIFAKR
jgi:F0F1-type ATP synthase membrane subunit b/b'